MCDIQWQQQQQPQFHRSIIQMNWIEFSNKFTQKWSCRHHFRESRVQGRMRWSLRMSFYVNVSVIVDFGCLGVERYVCHLHELETDMFLPTFFALSHSVQSLSFYNLFGDGIHSNSSSFSSSFFNIKKQQRSDMWCACSHHFVKIFWVQRKKNVVWIHLYMVG